MEGVGDDHVAAVGAGGAQVVQALEVAALALPVADGEVDELELGDVAEVGDGEDRGEDRLQAVVLALLGQLVHLQKALVAAALDFNEVGDLDGGGNLGKIEAAADRAHFAGHAGVLLNFWATARAALFEAFAGLPAGGPLARRWRAALQLSGFVTDCACFASPPSMRSGLCA